MPVATPVDPPSEARPPGLRETPSRPLRSGLVAGPWGDLLRLWSAWFALVLATAVLARIRGGSGFFTGTVERIPSPWISLLVLNLPLQLVLVALVATLANRPGKTAARATHVLAVVQTTLMALHVALSFAVVM